MRTLQQRPAVRWIAPAAALAVAAGGVFAAGTAQADVTLPTITAAKLIANVATAKTPDYSGTVSETADLGLPSLPVSSGHDSVDFTALLTGNHTLQVWRAGEDKSRVMLKGTFGESDLIRNGTSVWAWNSKAKTATHVVMPADRQTAPNSAPGWAPNTSLTPEEMAAQALKAVDASTTVTLDKNRMVAGQKAYELVLTPKSTDTLVGSVRIAVDGTTYLPLAVDVYAKANPDKAALSVDYTALTYQTPADEVFAFKAPAGTKVTENEAPWAGHSSPMNHKSTNQKPMSKAQAAKQRAAAEKKAQQNLKTVGDGWSSVVIAKVPTGADAKTGGQQGGPGSQSDQWQQVLANLPAVSGHGWTGHGFNGTLFSVVITDDNRVAIGAVPVDRLVADLG